MKVSRVFALACELGAANGWENISFDPGCKELQIDEHWWLAINPHNEANRCSRTRRRAVPPQSIYFEFNGWPAGIVNSGGGIIALGAKANERTLTAALEAAIQKTGRERW